MPPHTRNTSSNRSARPRHPEIPPEPAEPATPPASTATINLPYLHAEIGVPGPGINVKAGPIRVAIPTRYLYYGGLGALTVVGAVEWPIAGALAATGLLVNRLLKPTAASEPHETNDTAGAVTR